MKVSHLMTVACTGGAMLATSVLSADTYTATSSVSDWNNPTLWGSPQMAGNDFIFAGTASFHRLTTTSSSFNGDSLVLRGPGSISTGALNIDQDITFESYGVFSNGAHNTVHSGAWTIVDNGIFLARRPKSTLNIVLSGEGALWIGDDLTTKSVVVLAADSCNEFTGELVFGVPSESDVVDVEFSGDVSAPDLMVKIDAIEVDGVMQYSQLNLNHTIAVGAVELDGVVMEPGVYNFSDLSSEQQLFFIDNGGQLVVSPPDAPTGTLIEVSSVREAMVESAS